jgi:hypothetical protein
MTEPTITCPKCGTEIRLNEQLAAPLLEETRQKYERQLADKDGEVKRSEAAVLERERAVAHAQRDLELQVSQRVEAERKVISAEEARKATLKVSAELNQKTLDLEEMHAVLQERDIKLADAQKAQAEILRKERELGDEKRELELTIERRVSSEIDAMRSQARTEAEEQFRLKVVEKEQTISSMQRQIEELKRRAEQGSQQLQGEVQELELESILNLRFPHDKIEPVAKGEYGGDILHYVHSAQGGLCGLILWETKRTKNWSDAWLVKLRDDQRRAKAELAILVSHTLPKGVESFDFVDGIWVAHPRVMIPLALSLRQTLLDVSTARQTAEGQQTKATMVYQYLTGSRFRHRVQAIVEAFSSMQEDLEKEKRVILKQWSKREEQITRVMQSTVGMYGDLQGIAGKTIQEIEGLNMDGLSVGEESIEASTE